MGERNKERVQFDFSSQDVEKLDQISKKMDHASRAETIRLAITAYGFFADLDPAAIVEVCNKSGEVVFRGQARLLQ